MIPQKQILIVEDNEINRAILCEILSDEYRVLEAENGQVALDLLRECKDDIALILLDVMMPVMDGFTFLDHLKEDAQLSLIPVIVMTQSNSEEDEVAALAHGATDFVPKPYRPQVILHRVASIIKLRETAAIVNLLQYDRLTGLCSREFFYEKVRERLQKEPDKEYTIVCTNIENFKLYNDTFGISAGDRLLQQMSQALRERSGENAICGRYGGDRFMCLQEREQELKDRDLLEQSTFQGIKNVVMKWGIYEIIDRSVQVEQMCDRALLAADSVKGQYNRHFAVYDDTLRGKLIREKEITDAMESALTEKQFAVYLQPKYNLKGECMAGAEALVRWIHPTWGFISPGEFIPLFEKNGFIPQLDQYVWETVCELLQEWKQKGYPALPVSVNVSRADIYQIDLVNVLSDLTKKYDIEPSNLHLEITESAYAENPTQILNAINQLRKLGFVIEMDDFGSGYSSLNMLNQMQMDVLKLDMKFIQNEMAKPANQSILSYVVSMAHGMGLSVVAEGVETREQLERLQAIGCDYVQGYFLAKPMPTADYEKLLMTQTTCKVSSDRFRNDLENSVQSILIVDEDYRYIEKVRKAFLDKYRILTASTAESALEIILSPKREKISAMILSMTLSDNGAGTLMKELKQNPDFWHIPVLATVPNGEVMKDIPLALETDDFLCKCHPLCDLVRRIDRLITISESYEREIFLQNEASRDYLTGLLNRRGLQVSIDSIRKEDKPLAVCLFDLDDLKKINDVNGHDAGDNLIKSFADLLCRHTRTKDILCRYGGDEFLVILKHLRSKEDAKKKCELICQSFHSSCSAGIALLGRSDTDISRTIHFADQALYRAKRENKGGCCMWNEVN